MQPFTDTARLSLNQMTTELWSLREAVEGCARQGIPAIGLWRHKIAEAGLTESSRLVRDAGLRVSSVCRGGMFPASTARERQARIDDNCRAVDEAAALGADTLVLVCGASPDCDIDGARRMVRDGISQVVLYARGSNVRIGVEPLHPMFAAERSVIVTLAEANEIAEEYTPAEVGVVVDVYHLWWDPQVYVEIKRAAGRILGFHVSDWIVPVPDMLMGRGMMGDGVIELRRLREAVDEAGYDGFIEVEIFNRAICNMPGEETLKLMQARYLSCV
ncbi:MAG: sugar phosphate isomerase/epimerase [Pyrinomonadaceae bacterium]|nr:sugar phosphate isomerase/epimerase [Pyrinomonadaceae bacterium]